MIGCCWVGRRRCRSDRVVVRVCLRNSKGDKYLQNKDLTGKKSGNRACRQGRTTYEGKVRVSSLEAPLKLLDLATIEGAREL
jgi:hypothetical protein